MPSIASSVIARYIQQRQSLVGSAIAQIG